MLEVGFFIYGLLAMFVLTAMQRDQRLAKSSHTMVTAVGWGLFSMSSTLAVLFTSVAVALAMGVSVPIVDALIG